MKGKNRQKIALAVMLSFIGAVFCGFNYLAKQRDEAARIKSEKAKQVSVIPPGTEEAWQAFIDRRVAAVLHREGHMVRLDDDSHRNLMEAASYVSLNAPYQITCTLGETTIQFGVDSENNQGINDSVKLYDDYSEPLNSAQAHEFEKPPALGVPPESIAAATLRDHVCKYLANRVQSSLALQ